MITSFEDQTAEPPGPPKEASLRARRLADRLLTNTTHFYFLPLLLPDGAGLFALAGEGVAE
jgi:hypothetical protein